MLILPVVRMAAHYDYLNYLLNLQQESTKCFKQEHMSIFNHSFDTTFLTYAPTHEQLPSPRSCSNHFYCFKEWPHTDIFLFDMLLVLFTAERHLDCEITEAELQDRSLSTLLLNVDYEEAAKVLTLSLKLVFAVSKSSSATMSFLQLCPMLSAPKP